MEKEQFVDRLVSLRIKKGVSARDMSLSLGQSPGYINNIENGVNLPSMTVFFYICDYFGISPGEFFDLESVNPPRLRSLVESMKSLDDTELAAVDGVVQALRRNKKQ